MRSTAVAVLAVLAGLSASPAYGAARSIDVQISAHLRSDYRFSYDYVDTSSPDCPQTIRASSRATATSRIRHRAHTFTQGSPNQFGGGFTEVRTIEVTIRKLR